MSVKIGLFSLKPQVGVTTTSIHIANYLAASNKSVAIVEYPGNLNPEFGTAKSMEFDEAGTYVANEVRYYPAECHTEPAEDIIIIDYGHVNILFDDFAPDLNKLYLCTQISEDAIASVKDYLTGRRINPDIMVFSCSKKALREFLDEGYKAVLVSDKQDERVDYNLAMAVSLILRRNQIEPPEYHKDWIYDKVRFHYDPAEEQVEKKGFFGRKKKNTSEKKTGVEEPVEEVVVSDESDISVASRDAAAEANMLFDFDFDDIDAPVAPAVESTISNKNSATQSLEENVPQPEIIEIDRPMVELEVSEDEIEDTEEDPGQASVQLTKKELKAIKKAENIRAKEEKKQAKIDAKNAKRQAKLDAKEAAKNAAALKRAAGKEATNRKHIARHTKGLLGKLITTANGQFDNVANIFIVTKPGNLYVFNNVGSFFGKLDALLKELRDLSKIKYIVVTFNDAKEPEIFSDTPTGDEFAVLEALDIDIRREDFEHSDFANHKELQIFSEIIYA